MIFLNIFAEKIGKKLAFVTQNKAKSFEKLIITLVFEKNANFVAKNCRKSQKIVINNIGPGTNQKLEFQNFQTERHRSVFSGGSF
jgi:hypothetical protein